MNDDILFFSGASLSTHHPGAPSRRPLTLPRNLVVGVGGSGCLAVQSSVMELRQHHGGVPANCRFMVIDTTSEEGELSTRLPAGDFVNISGFNANQYFQRVENFPFLSWLPATSYLPGEISMGAHGFPHVGRLCYFMHREGKIRRAVDRKIQQLTHPNLNAQMELRSPDFQVQATAQAKIIVHLAASLCGGTGAGCILDAAFDLRRWCYESTGHVPFMVAHLLLPEAIKEGVSESTQRHHRVNAFSLLAQINHFSGDHEARVQYKSEEVVWPRKESPFDICFLLDGASGKSSTNRTRSCRHIGRMINILSTQYAGKRIWDSIDNVFTSLRSNGEEHAPAVFSSYEVAMASRPLEQVEELFAQKLSAYIATLSTSSVIQDPVPDASLSKLMEGQIVELEGLMQHQLGELSRLIEESELKAGEDTQPFNVEEEGKHFKKAVLEQLKESPKRTRQILNQRFLSWRKQNQDATFKKLLEKWIAEGQPNRDLGEYLISLKEGVRQATTRTTAEVEVAWKDVKSWFDDKIPARWYEDRNMVLEKFKHYLQVEIRDAWAACLSEQYSEISAFIDHQRTYLKELATDCRPSARGRWNRSYGHKGSNPSDGDLDLYHIHAGYETEEMDMDGKVSRAILCDWLLSRRRVMDVVQAVRQTALARPDIAETLDHHLRKFVRSREIADSEGNAGENEHLREGLNELFAAASPRWLIQPHKTVEEICCLVFPEDLNVRKAAEQLSETIMPIADNSYDGKVAIVNTQHGASLTDLQSYDLYHRAFQAYLQSRGSKFQASDLWLDRRWGSSILRPSGEFEVRDPTKGHLTFAVLFADEHISQRGGGFAFRSAASDRWQMLGKDLEAALKQWGSRANESAVVEAYIQHIETAAVAPLREKVRRSLQVAKSSSLKGPELLAWEKSLQSQLEEWGDVSRPAEPSTVPETAPTATVESTDITVNGFVVFAYLQDGPHPDSNIHERAEGFYYSTRGDLKFLGDEEVVALNEFCRSHQFDIDTTYDHLKRSPVQYQKAIEFALQHLEMLEIRKRVGPEVPLRRELEKKAKQVASILSEDAPLMEQAPVGDEEKTS